MKKVGFSLAIIVMLIAVFSLINIVLISDQGITPYGYGYIVGISLVFTLGLLGAILIGKKLFKSE